MNHSRGLIDMVDQWLVETEPLLGVSGGYGYLNASALRLPDDDRPDLTEKIGATFQWVLTTPDLPDVAAEEQLVVSAANATRRIPDGATIEVDDDTGAVRILAVP